MTTVPILMIWYYFRMFNRALDVLCWASSRFCIYSLLIENLWLPHLILPPVTFYHCIGTRIHKLEIHEGGLRLLMDPLVVETIRLRRKYEESGLPDLHGHGHGLVARLRPSNLADLR